jgi:hypothetical protein
MSVELGPSSPTIDKLILRGLSNSPPSVAGRGESIPEFIYVLKIRTCFLKKIKL